VAQGGIERTAGPDSHQGAGSEPEQLVHHDRRARATHAGCLHGHRLAVTRAAGIAPEAAVMVEHARLLEHRLGHRQGAVRVAGQEHPLRQLGGGPQVDRLAG
jgi:hypothetical protein